MKYRLVLFDADDTLFDFRKSERFAFDSALNEFQKNLPLDTLYPKYREISGRLWGALERREISKDHLRVARFKELLPDYDLDFNKLSLRYLELLPQNTFLIDGAIELCHSLKSFAKIGIVTNGFAQVQKARLAVTPLKDLVDFVVISEECGYEKPHAKIFEHTFERAGHFDKATTVMVGDRLETDIKGGLDAGISTCWFNPSRQANITEVKPHYEAYSLKDVTRGW